MEYSTKQELTQNVANWIDQHSRHSFNRFRSLYLHGRAYKMGSNTGHNLHSILYEGEKLLHDIFQGPFESLRASMVPGSTLQKDTSLITDMARIKGSTLRSVTKD